MHQRKLDTAQNSPEMRRDNGRPLCPPARRFKEIPGQFFEKLRRGRDIYRDSFPFPGTRSRAGAQPCHRGSCLGPGLLHRSVPALHAQCLHLTQKGRRNPHTPQAGRNRPGKGPVRGCKSSRTNSLPRQKRSGPRSSSMHPEHGETSSPAWAGARFP